MSDDLTRLRSALAGCYRIERELGRGGMATVFLAEDLKHHRPVAIKVLDPELAAAIGPERFLREIEVAARLQHPHILPLLDSGGAEGLLYYVMPYVAGESLRARLERERQLPVEHALELCAQVASALDYAHRHGVVHRDIKPENLLLEDRQAVVADFGIARAIAAAGGAKLTTTGVTLGTPLYMSPEQAMASRELDGRSDIYSLGCVLYEMLAGQPPFTGSTAESLVHQHLSVPPRTVSTLRTSVPEHVDQALAKALAKAAADRFGTAAEFAAAIGPDAKPAMDHPGDDHAVPEVDTRVATRGIKRPRKGGRSVAVALTAVVVAAVAVAAWQRWGPFARWLGGPSTAHAAKKDWILVAEFDGPAEDSLLVAATRDLVSAALDQSEIVAPVPLDQIRVALQMAGKPASTRVDAELARELAYRSAVRTVLDGRIGRLGKGYSVVVRVVDADSARVVLSVSDVAKNEGDLIPTVGRIGRRIRAALGERRSALQATRDLAENLMTPSLEAYKVSMRARALLLGNENRAAITVARSALALDPDYPAPWGMIGFAFSNLGEPDSAIQAFRQALARPERLPERAKLLCSATLASLSGDLPEALALSEKLVQLDPQNSTNYNNRGAYLDDAGRRAEALESFKTAEKFSPLGPSQQILVNQSYELLTLGRADEARALLPRLKGGYGMVTPMWIAAAGGQWSAAESLATTLRGNPSADDQRRAEAGWVLAAAQASRGQVRAADQTLRQVQSEAETARETLRANRLRWTRLALALFSHGVAADPGEPGRWDSTTAGLVTRGQWAAAAGDTALARQLLATIRTRSAPDVARQGFTPALLQAWIAARTGSWQEVLQDLGPAALQGEATGYRLFDSAPLVRWLVAEAYEQLGRPDSAAAYFERVIAPPPLGGSNFPHSRLAFSFGHRRLVLLYARMGRIEDANRHWRVLAETVRTPDPEIQPLIAEARAALVSAEGMAKSARR